MVKGVNKLIVDIANPNSEIFERAIFFVKPQMKDIPPKELSKNADLFISEQIGSRLRNNRRGISFSAVIGFMSAAGFGAVLAVIFIKITS